MSSTCKLCGEPSYFTHRSLILGKYTAEYYRCANCDFWFVLDPFWLSEAYEESISKLDTGLVDRNIRISTSLRAFINSIYSSDFVGVDWSGGTGLLTRLMRDRGIQYFSTDLYSENVHAKGFDWKNGDKVSLVSLIEVLEHVEYPLDFLSEILTSCQPSTVIFTQHLHGGNNSADWWYFMCDTGQHISFYSEKTLEYLGQKLDMRVAKYVDFYFLTSLNIRSKPRFLSGYSRVVATKLFSRFKQRESLTWHDHVLMKEKAK